MNNISILDDPQFKEFVQPFTISQGNPKSLPINQQKKDKGAFSAYKL
jgi:hypothetical protein